MGQTKRLFDLQAAEVETLTSGEVVKAIRPALQPMELHTQT